MSTISKALLSLLSASMNAHPLKSDEFRGIKGMGSHYFSLSSKHDGKDHLFSAVVDGITVYVYKVITEEMAMQ